MVNYSPSRLDATFGALADPTRRAILVRLSRGETSVTALAEPFQVSLPAILKHVRVLEEAGLLVRRKEGRVNRCRLRTRPMEAAANWIEQYRQYWERQFDALAHFLNESQGKEKQEWQRPFRARKRASRSDGHSRHLARRSIRLGHKEST